MTSPWPPHTALPPADHAGRRDRLRAAMVERGVDALYVTAPENVRYLTGFTGSNGQVLVGAGADGDLLVTDARYDERAATEAPGIAVHLTRQPVPAVLDRAAAAGATSLGFDDADVAWSQGEKLRDEGGSRGLRVEPSAGLVEGLRAVKDHHELAALRHACVITTDALTWLFGQLRPGISERRAAVALERMMVDLGAEAAGFPSIVAFGEHSAIPHHEPTGRKLRGGDLVKVDCGARVAGYHADTTRTATFGDPGARLRDVHELVRRAQAAGVAAATAGTAAGAVDAAARAVVEDAGMGEQFVHGTGHGVGLCIHEAPAVAKGSTDSLVPATALTVEPGVYLAGVGGVRIEDTVVVTGDDIPEILTSAPRHLITL